MVYANWNLSSFSNKEPLYFASGWAGRSTHARDINAASFFPSAGGRIKYLVKNGNLTLDFRYELGLIDLQKKVSDNTSNVNRAMIIGITYLKKVGR